MVRHPNGAVVPDDTASVKFAKGLHLTAKSYAAFNGYHYPTYPVAAVKPVEQKVAVAPVAYSHYTPYAYHTAYPTYSYMGYPRVFKREAEAEPEADAEADPQVFYRTYGYYPSWYNQATYTTPYTRYGYQGYPTTYTTPFHGYNYFNRFVKRDAEAEPEADAEADPQVFYRTYGYYPSWYNQARYTTPYMTRYANTQVYQGYPTTYTTPFFNYVKRDAEAEPEADAEADPEAYYRTYGYYPSWYNTNRYMSAYPYASRTYGYNRYTTPYNYNNYYGLRYKRDAESEPEAQYYGSYYGSYNRYNGYNRYTYGGYPYRTSYGYPRTYGYNNYYNRYMY